MSGDYLYDVAFSFLGPDEHLARRLNELLKDRWSTFIYSDPDRQAKIAGRDGIEAFARVFAEQSRTVVVLYRAGWGEHGFTVPEATAIKNRGNDDAFNFATFISLDKKAPVWLPRNRIWLDLERFGIETAARVIDSRVQESFGVPREDTPATAARRLLAEKHAESAREVFLFSDAGVAAANEEFDKLFAEVERLVEDTEGLFTRVERYPNVYWVNVGGDRRVAFEIKFAYSNTTLDMVFTVEEWPVLSRAVAPSWKRQYVFWLGPSRERGWREEKGVDSPFLTSARLVDEVAKIVIERLRNRPRP